MFGIIIGTLCLLGLIRVLMKAPFRFRRHFGGRHGRRRRMKLFYRLFERLETTPEQERVIRAAGEELMDELRGLKGELLESRGDLARAVRAETFDEEAMAAVFSRHDDIMEKARRAFVGALAKTHVALDDRQRRKLAELLETGPRWGLGPYRRHGRRGGKA